MKKRTKPDKISQKNKEEKCKSKYPLILIHGVGWKDTKIARYWFRIPGYLEKYGATIHVTNQDAWNSHHKRAEQVATEIETFIQKQQCDKVNLICHSQGSLDARWMIEKLKIKNKHGKLVPANQVVASFTSIGGVHLGTPIADIITGIIPRKLQPKFARGIDRLAKKIFHDKEPHSWEAGKELGAQYMQEVFNKECPIVNDSNGGIKDGIYYQSYATRMRIGAFLSLCPADRILLIPWIILKKMQGENDGLVSVESAKFGKFRGIKSGIFFGPGVGHLSQINQPVGLVCFFNAKKWIAEIVADLKNLGY